MHMLCRHQPDVEDTEVALQFIPGMSGLVQIDLPEAHLGSRPGTGEFGDIRRDDVANLRIAADGLALTHQDDGLALRGYLQGSSDHWLGHHLPRLPELELGSLKPRARAVGGRADFVEIFREQAVGFLGEPIRLNPREVAEFHQVPIGVGPGNVPLVGHRSGAGMGYGQNVSGLEAAAVMAS